MSNEKLHYFGLNHAAEYDSKKYPNGIPVTAIAPLSPRSDSGDIFDEAEKFAGYEEEDGAQAYISLIAAPHVKSTIPRDTFAHNAKEIFGIEPGMPASIQETSLLSPQVGIWWRMRDGIADQTALHTLNHLSPIDQTHMYDVIAKQVHKGVRFVSSLGGKPVIWGSWGHGTDVERRKTGGTRGGPTNALGHCHVTRFDKEAQDVELRTDLDTQTTMNFFGSWNTFLNKNIGKDVSLAFSAIVKNTLGSDVDYGIRMPSADSDDVRISKGYTFEFADGIGLEDTFHLLSEIGGRMEDGYQQLRTQYGTLHKASEAKEKTAALDAMQNTLVAMGFPLETTPEIIDFLKKVRPTVSQMEQWKKELINELGGGTVVFTHKGSPLEVTTRKLRQAERVRSRLERSRQPEKVAFLLDTLRTGDEYKNIILTWPVHASFAFVINDYKTIGEETITYGISLYPLVGTSETGPVREMDMLILRPTTAVVLQPVLDAVVEKEVRETIVPVVAEETKQVIM